MLSFDFCRSFLAFLLSLWLEEGNQQLIGNLFTIDFLYLLPKTKIELPQNDLNAN